MLDLLYYFIPAYIANMSPPFLAKMFPKWDYPIDGGLTFKGKRLLGANKTIRGVIGGTLLAGITFLIQKIVWPISTIPYDSLPPWFGLIMGFGAIFVGDAGKSFIKRRIAIRPGRPWIPFDQIDYTIGVFVVTFGFFWPGWTLVVLIVLINALFSIVTHYLGAKIHLMKDKI